MTKFLKQTCSYESAIRDAQGSVVLDMYGEPSYMSPKTLRCRRERTTKDVLTSNGSILMSATVYYTDESEIIRVDDKLDGRVVLAVEEYTNEHGLTEGFVSHA